MSNRYQNNCAKWIQVTQTDDFTELELLFQIKSFKVKSPWVWTLGENTQPLEIRNGRQDTTFSLALLSGYTIQLHTSYSSLLFCVSLSWLGYDNMEVTEVAECDIEHCPCVCYWVFFIMQAIFLMLMRGSHVAIVSFRTQVFPELWLCPPTQRVCWALSQFPLPVLQCSLETPSR